MAVFADELGSRSIAGGLEDERRDATSKPDNEPLILAPPSPLLIYMSSLNRQFLLPALRSRNYRLFFAGQGVSLIGTWVTHIATVWLVYHLTNSALMLGIVGFISQIPIFVLTPFGGIFVDRSDPRRILIWTQILAMLQSLTLATLVLSDVIQIWHLLALSLFQGIINAIDAPARQVFAIELVENRAHLPNALAIDSTTPFPVTN